MERLLGGVLLTRNKKPNIDTAEIQKHNNALSKQDWQKLFDLIPEIEATKEFSTGEDVFEDKNDPERYIITSEFEAPIVDRFRNILEELDLVFGFNWTDWDDGKIIFREKKYENLDTITLLKLINALIRSDHFSYEAALASKFQDGTIGKILKEIKKNFEKERDSYNQSTYFHRINYFF